MFRLETTTEESKRLETIKSVPVYRTKKGYFFKDVLNSKPYVSLYAIREAATMMGFDTVEEIRM